jgi:hypothetical protein
VIISFKKINPIGLRLTANISAQMYIIFYNRTSAIITVVIGWIDQHFLTDTDEKHYRKMFEMMNS